LNHLLLRSNAFVRDSKRLLRKRPDLAEQLLHTLRLLEADPQTPSLKTHKLKGRLKIS
jgi:mRNA-degrading endonuclease YafQ of YafQ-DinJ toxin-antitoxin module